MERQVYFPDSSTNCIKVQQTEGHEIVYKHTAKHHT